jgi:hypothetical protein
VALHAKVPDVGLSLAPRVHRQEQRIVGGVGVHARCPLFVLALMTAGARHRVHQLLAAEVDRLGRGFITRAGERGAESDTEQRARRCEKYAPRSDTRATRAKRPARIENQG